MNKNLKYKYVPFSVNSLKLLIKGELVWLSQKLFVLLKLF